MHPGHRPSRSLFPASRGLLTALLLIVAVSSAVPVRAAPAAVRTGVVWALSVYPRRSAKFCVGEKQEYFVSINEQVSAEAGAVAYTSSQSVAGARIVAVATDEQVGSLSPTGGTAGIVGGAYQTRHVFIARKPGSTTLVFSGSLPTETSVQSPDAAGDDLAALAEPDVQVSIPIRVVRCRYRLSIFGGWTHPGERALGLKSTMRDALLEPDDAGNFTAQAPMETLAFWYGACPGQSNPTDVVVSISGSVQDGTLQASVEYPVVSAITTEGCKGKSRSDTGQLDRLDFTMPASTGVTTRPHILRNAPDLYGTSVIMLLAEELQGVALRDRQTPLARPHPWSTWFVSLGGG